MPWPEKGHETHQGWNYARCGWLSHRDAARLDCHLPGHSRLQSTMRQRIADGARFWIGISQLIGEFAGKLISKMSATLHAKNKACGYDISASALLRFGDEGAD